MWAVQTHESTLPYQITRLCEVRADSSRLSISLGEDQMCPGAMGSIPALGRRVGTGDSLIDDCSDTAA